jgi:mannose-6-phosphate isomerase-like protein (cupin superfamily)
MSDAGFDLESEYVILDAEGGARTTPGGAAFWEALMGGRMPDVERGRLVTIGESTESWSNWEMHPQGEELIVLLEGRVDFVLDEGGSERVITLDRAGRSLVIPRGTWHTARVSAPARMLFVTAGAGTQHRVAEPSPEDAKPTQR